MYILRILIKIIQSPFILTGLELFPLVFAVLVPLLQERLFWLKEIHKCAFLGPEKPHLLPSLLAAIRVVEALLAVIQ